MKRFSLWLASVILTTQAFGADTAYQFGSSDESLQWFPAFATRQGPGWTVRLHGLITEDEKRTSISRLSQKLLGFSSEELGPVERTRFEETTQRFMSDDEGGKDIKVQIDSRTFDLGETERNGHFAGTIFLEEKLFP